MDWTSIILSSVFSGLLGVAISNIYHQKNEVRREKLQLISQLIGNRNDLQGQEFSEALNKIFITFYKSKPVLIQLKKFHDVVSNRNRAEGGANDVLLDLFKTLCKDVGIKIEPLNDNFFLMPFNVRGSSMIPNNAKRNAGL